MDRGWSILIYPEGTRSTTGKLGTFQRGIGLLATELRAPIVPILVTGTYAALPKGRTRPRPGPITVRFGEPVTLSPGADVDTVTAKLEGAVSGLAPL
jgi:long-chain acyl-CoA synthetase